MTRRLVLVFDGDVLRPEEPLDLEPNTRVAAVLNELPPCENRGTAGQPLRVFHLGGEELSDDDLYASA